MDELGTNEIAELMPIPLPVSDSSKEVQEKGTRRYGFSFYYHQPNVASHSSLDAGHITPQVYYYYAFRTIYSKDVNVVNYVDWVQIGSQSHNVGTSELKESDDK